MINIRREKQLIQIRKSEREKIFKQKRNGTVTFEDKTMIDKFCKLQKTMLAEKLIYQEKEILNMKELISEIYGHIQMLFLKQEKQTVVMDICVIMSQLMQDQRYYELCRQYLVNSQTFELIYNQLYSLNDAISLIRLIQIEDESQNERFQCVLIYTVYIMSLKYDNAINYIQLDKYIDLYLLILVTSEELATIQNIIITLSNLSYDDPTLITILLKRDIITKIFQAISTKTDSPSIYTTFFTFIQHDPIPQIMDINQFQYTIQLFAQSDFPSDSETSLCPLNFFSSAFKYIPQDQSGGSARVTLFLESQMVYRVSAACIQSKNEEMIQKCFQLFGSITNIKSDSLIKSMIQDNILIPIQYYIRTQFEKSNIRNYLLISLANILAQNSWIKQLVFNKGFISMITTEFHKEVSTLQNLNEIMYCIINALHECTFEQFEELFENEYYDCIVLYISSVDQAYVDISVLQECFEILCFLIQKYQDDQKVNIKDVMKNDTILIQKCYYYLQILDEQNTDKINILLNLIDN